jgi:hypothetical protein
MKHIYVFAVLSILFFAVSAQFGSDYRQGLKEEEKPEFDCLGTSKSINHVKPFCAFSCIGAPLRTKHYTSPLFSALTSQATPNSRADPNFLRNSVQGNGETI